MVKTRQYTVKSTLHAVPWLKGYIEKLVQATSELEARGSAVYTLALLRATETFGENLPKQFFEQGFVTACLKSVRSDTPPKYSVNQQCLQYLVHARREVPPALTEVDLGGYCELVNSLGRRYITMIKNNIVMHTRSRQRKAIHLFVSRQYPASTKSMVNYLTNRIVWEIAKAVPNTEPDPLKYSDQKVPTTGVERIGSTEVRNFIVRHQSFLTRAGQLEVATDDSGGIFSDVNLTTCPENFFSYLVFLFDTIKDLSSDRTQAPFQLVPQLKMRTRSITIGVEQLAEIMSSLGGELTHHQLPFSPEDLPSTLDFDKEKVARYDTKINHATIELTKKRKRVSELTPDVPDSKRTKLEAQLDRAEKACSKIKLFGDKFRDQTAARKTPRAKVTFGDVTKDQWKAFHHQLTRVLFCPPPNILSHWNGVVTTDGVSASWHMVKSQPKAPSYMRPTQKKAPTPSAKLKPKPEVLAVSKFGPVSASHRPVDYGTHAKDMFIERGGDLNIIGVDPGHIMLIDAVREHTGPVIVPTLAPNASRTSIKRARLPAKLAQKNRTHFSLSNGAWKNVCGRTTVRDKNLNLHNNLCLQPAVNILAEASAKVGTAAEYLLHVRARLRTMGAMKSRSQTKAPRRWKFECYRLEQLAARKLSKDLLGDCTGNSVIVWGNGGFGPTSRGHASAPNKRLRRLLSKYVPIVLSSEYRSSQCSACCHRAMTSKKRTNGKRAEVKQCTNPTCKTLLSRDVSAACVIIDIFKFQRHQQEDRLPLYITQLS